MLVYLLSERLENFRWVVKTVFRHEEDTIAVLKLLNEKGNYKVTPFNVGRDVLQYDGEILEKEIEDDH